MDYNSIIDNKYTEPAAVLAYKDGQVKVLAINDRFLDELWMNISPEDFMGREYKKSFDDDNMRRFKTALESCIKTGEEKEAETWRFVFSTCCGFDKICLKSRLIPVDHTEDGDIIFEGVRNISNEKRMQDSLEDIEYRYKAASEQINIYNWEYSVETKEMRPCYRCMRDLGLPALVTNYPEPAIDMGIFPPDYADMYREMMHKIDEGIPEIEADIPLTVGRVPFRVKYTTEYDEEGKPIKAFGSATLISETELGHIKLDNQIISTLAEGYDCIYVADFISNTVRIVKQESIFSLDEDAYCKELAEMIASKLRDTEQKFGISLGDVDSLRGKLFSESENREFVYKDEDGDRWIRVNYSVIERSALGVDRLLITAAVVDDIRAQKMDADRVISMQKEELEDRQKMLLAAINEANSANKARTEFFSSVSHDIRTPMNVINGFSKLAMDEIDDKEHVKDYLGKISNAGDHLLNLINDILDMSKLESGKMELVNSPAKVKDLILGCADMIRISMDKKKLKFFVDVDEAGDDVVECDKLHFNQVLLNLLSNACKFTPEGGSVTLSGKLIKQETDLTYEIRVKDTGIGMSEEFSKHIFEPYTRERSQVVHETQGTGLGMVIVQNIVNLMNGTIELVTEQGKGSEFIIVLSLARSSDGTGAVRDEKEIDVDVMTVDYTGTTALVVDDTAANLKLADRLLSKHGFKVITADSAVTALDILKESKPGDIDVVLMDVLMPVMDGLEATKRIRAFEDPDMAAIPIIAMTANAYESDVKKVLDAGMDAHVPKPFRIEELLKKIYGVVFA
ncbi:MAG: response regulator [Eubacterium sp.]|nr:response regulator [Eubacterium sp.]